MNFLFDLFYENPNLKGYGLFHFSFAFLTLIFIILFIFIGLKQKEKQFDLTIFIFGIIFLGLEIFGIWLHNKDNETFDWGSFPFQLCSTPIYCCLITPLLPKKAKKFGYSFMAFYLTVAGISVFVNPDSVIIPLVISSVRSLIWHGAMIVIGFYVIAFKSYGKKLTELLPGGIVFLIAVLIATSINVIFYKLGLKNNIDYDVNMMYISPYEDSVLDFLNIIKEKTNWFCVLFTYIFGISLGAIVIWLFPYLYRLMINKLRNIQEKKLKALFLISCISYTFSVISLLIYFTDVVIKYLNLIGNYFLIIYFIILIIFAIPSNILYIYLANKKEKN